jgi:hypothetical protein
VIAVDSAQIEHFRGVNLVRLETKDCGHRRFPFEDVRKGPPLRAALGGFVAYAAS